MNPLKIPENLARLRKEKKITQEELADFIGVTKAAVSKWENGQSLPDILLLPQLATYFNVSLDDLFGYEPQLSRRQIQHIYQGYTAAFASRPFAEVMAEVRATARQYYACYPLLLQLAVLYLNHCPLAGDADAVTAVVQEAKALCEHILANCTVVSVNADAASLNALLDLQLGNTDDAIQALEPNTDPARFSRQDEATLIQAYYMAGQQQKATDYAQISMYLHLLSLVGTSVQYMSVNSGDEAACEETIRRVDSLAKTYQLERLHPNVMAQFHYQSALTFMALGRQEEALEQLDAYANAVRSLLTSHPLLLHGDAYFSRIEPWFETLDLGASPPRDAALIRQSALQGLSHPAFQALQDLPAFEAIQYRLKKE